MKPQDAGNVIPGEKTNIFIFETPPFGHTPARREPPAVRFPDLAGRVGMDKAPAILVPPVLQPQIAMLMYFNRGSRQFARRPNDVTVRYNWEFYAVTAGCVAPYFSEAEKLEPATSTLWLIPPHRQYSWWSRTKKADRIVFHFSTVDESLRLLMGSRNLLQVKLNRKEIAKVGRLAAEVEPHYQDLKLVSSLHFSRVLAELSLLIVRDCDAQDEVVSLSTKNQVIARRALSIYESRLPHRLLIEEVAEMVNVSTVHLRRIFLEVFHQSPKQLFLVAQLELAKRLAADSNLLISDIANRSGFVGAPHLCHAFQKHHNLTFNKWRTNLAGLKRQPHLRRRAFSHDLAPAPMPQSS